MKTDSKLTITVRRQRSAKRLAQLFLPPMDAGLSGEFRAAVKTFVQSREQESAFDFEVELDGEDLLDVQSQALQIKGMQGADLFLKLCERLADTRSALNRLKQLRRSYEKARGIQLNTTAKGRQVIALLEDYYQTRKSKSSTVQRAVISRLLQALDEGDAQFFECIATAMHFRQICCGDTAKARARRARIAISEAAIYQDGKPSMTWREAQRKFYPDFRGENKNFQRMLDECGFRYKRANIGRPRKLGTKNSRTEVYSVTPRLNNAVNGSLKIAKNNRDKINSRKAV